MIRSMAGQLYRDARRAVIRTLPDKLALGIIYRDYFGIWPDLENPRTLSEKIHWLKLNTITALHRRCSDKITAPDYVRGRLGEDFLVPRILATHDVADINPQRITAERFVVKTSHDTGSILFCQDRAGFDWENARSEMRRALRRSFYRYHREYQYATPRPGIVVDEYVDPESPIGMIDYKVWCFHGKAHWIEVQLGLPPDLQSAFYSLDWEALRLTLESAPNYPTNYDGAIPAPARLPDLISAAERLAKPFPLVRADFYCPGQRVLFGELTFTPGAGLERYGPGDADRRFGDLLDLDRARAQIAEIRAESPD